MLSKNTNLSKPFNLFRNKVDQTPLMISCKKGYVDLCLLLGEMGANIHEKNISGETAIKLAQSNGFEDLSLVLISKYGASKRQVVKKGTK